MKDSARTYAFATVVAAVLALFAPSSALGYTSTGTTYPLIVVDNGAGAQQDPRISGNVAAYTDDQGGVSSRIEYFDFTTSAANSIPTSANSIDFLADISGDAIVFTRLSAGGSAIFQHSIGAGTTTEVAPPAAPATPNRRNPTVGGSTVAWEDVGVSSTSDAEIVVSSGNTTHRLTNDALADRNPNIAQDGRTLVWEKCAATCDVYAATDSGSSWVTTPVATSGADEIWPDTNGGHIVYASNEGGNYHVYVTALGGSPTQLTVPGSLSENHPAVAGDFRRLRGLDRYPDGHLGLRPPDEDGAADHEHAGERGALGCHDHRLGRHQDDDRRLAGDRSRIQRLCLSVPNRCSTRRDDRRDV